MYRYSPLSEVLSSQCSTHIKLCGPVDLRDHVYFKQRTKTNLLLLHSMIGAVNLCGIPKIILVFFTLPKEVH
jgi:hypothetical protein